MRVYRYTDRGFAKALAGLSRKSEPAPEVEQTVREIIAAVRQEGDRALRRLNAQFGGESVSHRSLKVFEAEIAAASKSVASKVKSAIKLANTNVRAFAECSLRQDWTMTNEQGVETGERFDPFQRVGIYVPGGSAPLVSTAVMTVTLAAAAGVPEIVVTTPADRTGSVNPALLHALAQCGATEVYKVGGAQAIAALAYGTKSIAPVAKIFGPGNAYVVEAKRQVFGRVGIDLLPGPSEILIIADATARAAWVAADMLAQAEHGLGSSVVLVTDSEKVVTAVQRELETQTARLGRQAQLREAQICLILVEKINDAVAIANDFAPEHVSIAAKRAQQLAKRIRTAGAIFLGGISPVVGGDFVAGPSHTLPTSGAGRSFAGLTADQFQRRTSLIRFDRASLERSLPAIQIFSEIEGLDAHGRSAAIRLGHPL